MLLHRSATSWGENAELGSLHPDPLICKFDELNAITGSVAISAYSCTAVDAMSIEEVLPIIRRLQWNQQLSITLFNLGTLMKDREDFVRAESYYEECLALNRKLANRERLVEVLVEFSTLLRKQAEYEQAQIYLQEGLEQAQQMGHRRLLSTLWLEAGELFLQTARLDEAERAFNEVLEHLPDGQHSLDVGTHYGLARVAALRGNIDEARRLGEECLASLAASGYLRLEEVRVWLNSLPHTF